MDTESPLGGALIDHTSLDLEAAHRITYRIEQSFRYTYDAPVTSLSQRLIVVPRARHGDQSRRAHLVEVTGAKARRRTRQDLADNTVVRVTAPLVEHTVEFRMVATLDRHRCGGPTLMRSSALRHPALREPTTLTAADDRLRAMADDLMRDGGGPLDLAERVCVAVHAALRYEYGVTTVESTAAEALAAGAGVCQDAAHVMLALCHIAGLPARYVSGHLLGQGGTHAWVEVIVAHQDAARAVAFDPCHGRRTHSGYVTTAVGRDYADVAPTSGTYVGGPGSTFTSTRHVGVVALDASGCRAR